MEKKTLATNSFLHQQVEFCLNSLFSYNYLQFPSINLKSLFLIHSVCTRWSILTSCIDILNLLYKFQFQ